MPRPESDVVADFDNLPDTFAFLDRPQPGLAADLALDEALLIEADEQDGPPLLRVWEAAQVAVVLGATCPWRQAARVETCEDDGVPILRRSSGGGAVVIGPGALNVAVVLPIGSGPGAAALAVDGAQKAVLERIAQSLRNEVPGLEMLGSGDLTIAGRKVSGSAQRRLRRYFLVHATILYDFPLDLIPRYLGPPRREPAYRAGRDHASFVANLPIPREQLVRSIRSAWLAGKTVVPGRVPEERVAQLIAEKFGDRAWVERF